MTVINPIWFYIISVVSKLSVVVGAVLILLGISLISLIIVVPGMYDDMDLEEQKVIKKVIKTTVIGTVIFGSLYIIIPNDKTIYKMLIAKNVTYENLDKAQEVIKDSVDYIFDKIDGKGDGNND